MAEISASLVKELRDQTNVSMMECKRALVEAAGDKDKALKILRERGLAIAGKKSARAANSGIVAGRVFEQGRIGALVEVNCETDFVARNEIFRAFVGDLVQKAAATDAELAPAMKDVVAAKVAEIGENIILKRNLRFVAQGTGAVATYIHLGDKVGVMLEVGCTKPETVNAPVFQDLLKDLTLHVAACSPGYLDRAEVPAALVTSEKEIFAKQVEGKPANIVEKIVLGKLEKFYAQVCFVEQAFVKDDKQTVTQLLAAKGKELGDTLNVRRFVRWTLGE